MYNTSTITQVPTNTQTTTTQVSINTQTTTMPIPTSTQTTLPVPIITQTTIPQAPVSSMTLPNIGQTVITPVGITTGTTQEGSSIGKPGNNTGGFNFFNNLYPNIRGFGYYGNTPQNQGFRFNNTQNLPLGFGGGFGGGNPGRPSGGGGNPGGPPGGGATQEIIIQED